MLRLVDPETGERLRTPLEAEAEVERLEAELARLRAATGEAKEKEQ